MLLGLLLQQHFSQDGNVELMLLLLLVSNYFLCLLHMYLDILDTHDTQMTSKCHPMTPNDSGALAKLDLSENDLRSEGLKSLSEVLNSTSIAQLNLARNNLSYNVQFDSDMSGVIKFAQDMQDNGALACDSGMVYKAPLLGSKCKNCGKGKDQHKKRCVLLPFVTLRYHSYLLPWQRTVQARYLR